MADQWMTREEYVGKLERGGSRATKAGLVLLLAGAVCVGVSWLLWRGGVGYQPGVYEVVLASGFLIGMAVMVLILAVGVHVGVVQRRRRWEGFHTPPGAVQGEPRVRVERRSKRLSTYAIVVCAALMLSLAVAAVWIMFDMVTDPSSYGAFELSGFADASMASAAGVMFGGVVVLAWGIREAVGWRKPFPDASDEDDGHVESRR